VPQSRLDDGYGLFRQARIRMQEQQGIPLRHGGAGVHLPCPSRRGRQHDIRQARGQFRRAIRAAAVHHDHLMARAPQPLERRQAGGDHQRLVQGGQDDGEFHRAAFRRQS